MRKILVYSLLLLFLSCSKYKLYKSKIIDYNFTVPNQFEEITPTNYLIKLIDSNEEKNLVDLNFGSIESLLSYEMGFSLLYDTSNFNNNIIIYEGEYIDLSAGVGSQYLGLLEESLYENWNAIDIDYSKLQSKYVHHKQTEYFKIVYERNSNEEKNYFTQYIVSSQKRTIYIVFNNKQNIDYEEIIKPIDLKVKPTAPFRSKQSIHSTVIEYVQDFFN